MKSKGRHRTNSAAQRREAGRLNELPRGPLKEIVGISHMPGAPSGIARAWKDNRYSVQLFHPVDAGHFGYVERLSIRRHDEACEFPWDEIQAIKNRVCGDCREAIELFPVQDDVVDVANMCHLWVLPEGRTAPFGWRKKDTQTA